MNLTQSKPYINGVKENEKNWIAIKRQTAYYNIIITYDLTAWKASKYGVFSGPYFPVFSPNTGKYGPGKAPYLDAFHAVSCVTTAAVFITHRELDYYLTAISNCRVKVCRATCATQWTSVKRRWLASNQKLDLQELVII